MRINVRFLALFLAATGMFAQRGGGFRGGSMPGFGHPGFVGHRIFVGANPGSYRNFGNRPIIPGFPFGSMRSGGNARFLGYRFGLNRGRFGGGLFGFPYYPLLGSYGDGYFPTSDYLAVGDDIPSQPSIPAIIPPPPQPAHPVIHEYKWNDQVLVAASDQVTFTIALRDGSRLAGATTWVQDGKLHYIDSEGKQGALSPDLIDRDTTQRMNQEKNLHLHLPPD